MSAEPTHRPRHSNDDTKAPPPNGAHRAISDQSSSFELATDPSLAGTWRERREAPVDHIERAEELLARRIGEADETNIGQSELIALAQVHALLAICDLLEELVEQAGKC
jgi:hypothetical protein